MGEFYTRRPVYARRMPRHAWAVLAASVILSACAGPSVSFPNATPGAPRVIPAAEVRPEGVGPFPAVVLMHGCHGVSASTRQWAGWFRDHGYVALIVDSWAPRKIRDGCVPGPDIASSERFDDAVGALRWLHAHFRNIPPAPPTFPARRPVFALDRIWVSPSGGVTRLARHSSSLARVASDHLPLVADIVV